MVFALKKSTFIEVSITVGQHSLALPFVNFVFTFIMCSISMAGFANTRPVVFYIVSSVNATIGVGDGAFTIPFSALELTTIL